MTKVCKTFMRRFDPGPRLQTPFNLFIIKGLDSFFHLSVSVSFTHSTVVNQ